MKRTLEITFALDDAKTKAISLLDPREDLTREETQKWADSVVAKKALVVKGALPTAFQKAIVRTVDEQELA